MVALLVSNVVSLAVGAVVSYLFLRKNPKIAAQVNQVASQASTVVNAAEKKL